MASGYLLLGVLEGPDVLTLSYRSRKHRWQSGVPPVYRLRHALRAVADHHLCSPPQQSLRGRQPDAPGRTGADDNRSVQRTLGFRHLAQRPRASRNRCIMKSRISGVSIPPAYSTQHQLRAGVRPIELSVSRPK